MPGFILESWNIAVDKKIGSPYIHSIYALEEATVITQNNK